MACSGCMTTKTRAISGWSTSRSHRPCPESYHTSPLNAAVEILWFNGIVVVVSAGNNGTADGPSTLYPPANDPFVITVGATEDIGTTALGDDNMAVFSAYGITEDGFCKT